MRSRPGAPLFNIALLSSPERILYLVEIINHVDIALFNTDYGGAFFRKQVHAFSVGTIATGLSVPDFELSLLSIAAGLNASGHQVGAFDFIIEYLPFFDDLMHRLERNGQNHDVTSCCVT